MSKRRIEFVVPVVVLAVFLLLNIDFDGELTVADELATVQAAMAANEPTPQIQDRQSAIATLEQRAYDLLLRWRPAFNRAVVQRDDVLFMDVDDTAIVQVGDWPWTRDYMARGLIVLREFESDFVTFDIEYVEDSQLAVNRDYLTGSLPTSIQDEFFYVYDNFEYFVQQVAAGAIPADAAGEYLPDIFNIAADSVQYLLGGLQEQVPDYDAFLGDAARFHGKAYFTVNILEPAKIVAPDPDTFKSEVLDDNLRDLATDLAGQAVTHNGGELPRTGLDILPAIAPILSGAAGAGFPNVVVDRDGIRRRIDLFAEVEDDYFGQLIIAPMLDLLGSPEVELYDDHVVLRGAILPDTEEATDIEIPLGADGRMLINWPEYDYLESFRHETFYRLVDAWEREDSIVSNLELMAGTQVLSGIAPEGFTYLDFHYSDSLGSGIELLNLYDYAELLRADVMAGGDRAQIGEWREYRTTFFDELGIMLSGDTQAYFEETYESVLSDPNLSPDLAARYQEELDFGVRLFDASRGLYDPLMENRNHLAEVIPGSKIIVGWTGTSTTDIGANPFESEYVNVGTHGAVYNTIIQQDFLDDTQWWVPFVIGAALCVILTLLSVIVDLDPGKSLIVGFSALILVAVGGVAAFVFGGRYFNLATPLLSVLVTFLALTIIKFLKQNKEKRFIRETFEVYLAPDVINEIVKENRMPELKGESFKLTAIFTDVEKFSTISEKLTPVQLVELMNRYLDPMSTEILDEQGTIDKYEGDAIIAFFGAPRAQEDHAIRACRAAVRMKKIEEALSQTLMDEGVAPSSLFTRIGLNSGIAVVGNMGTERKMNYTMMGDMVNLAARLEGVNKKYFTYTLMSQETYDQTYTQAEQISEDRPEGQVYDQPRSIFSVRKLDRVRVVGKDEPVRLYELIDLRSNVDHDKELIADLRHFNEGLRVFEDERDWKKARKIFQELWDQHRAKVKATGAGKEDCAARRYVEQCAEFMKTPPPANWDGVFKLTTK